MSWKALRTIRLGEPASGFSPLHAADRVTISVEIKQDHGTSHFCAADASGLVISMTSTVLLYWGSRLMDPATGVVLNNGMEDFSVAGQANTWGFEGTPANYIAGGKRPLSSQSPYIIEGQDGILFAGGCAGGSRIISANVQCARNYLVCRAGHAMHGS